MNHDNRDDPRRLPVRLEIEQLHLHGFPEHARAILVAALERELADVIAARGAPADIAGRLHLERVRIDCAAAPDLHHAGRDAARNLFAQMQAHALVHGVAPAAEPVQAAQDPAVGTGAKP